MNDMPENFLRALQNSTPDDLKNALKFMIYETQWPDKALFRTAYYDNEDVYVVRDWTPLAQAAYDGNEIALAFILEHWPEHMHDLVTRTYTALDAAFEALDRQTALCDEWSPLHASLDKEQITQAHVLIRHHLASRALSFQYTYNATNNKAYFDYLSQKITSMNDVESLIQFYNTYIDPRFITYQTRGGFFSSPQTTYSNQTIELITLLHHHVHRLLPLIPKEALIPHSQRLLSSAIFSTKHHQYGVETQAIRQLISKLDPNQPFTAPTNTPLPDKNPERHLLSPVFKLLKWILESISALFKAFFTMIQRMMSAIIHTLSGTCDSNHAEPDLSTPSYGL